MSRITILLLLTYFNVGLSYGESRDLSVNIKYSYNNNDINAKSIIYLIRNMKQ